MTRLSLSFLPAEFPAPPPVCPRVLGLWGRPFRFHPHGVRRGLDRERPLLEMEMPCALVDASCKPLGCQTRKTRGAQKPVFFHCSLSPWSRSQSRSLSHTPPSKLSEWLPRVEAWRQGKACWKNTWVEGEIPGADWRLAIRRFYRGLPLHDNHRFARHGTAMLLWVIISSSSIMGQQHKKAWEIQEQPGS